MQLEVYRGRPSTTAPPPPPPPPSSDFRSYSSSYAYSNAGPKELKANPEFGPSSSSRGGWLFSDPDFQRKRRVAGYKAYAVEVKVKGSLRRSFRWLKDKYFRVVYGW
ncbi:uncharacterized protein LOC121985086 [Zingiber officinale]|uniref:Uncharacterized protein n=1 Tax=Zingiber officinale TaxID=94328 RepID=A0A8J5L2D4_ZINOF|nr:uncharacterized protein LOC121985086 [Zingiber officinale]KAG6504189.1 hypothetical protein ZIOFF_036520 [Zingiber officinale]